MSLKAFASHSDRANGFAVLGLGVFLLFESSGLPFGTLNAPDSGFFPTILSVLLMLFGGALVVLSFWTEAAELDFTWRSWAMPTAGIVLLLYAALLERIGFLICTTVVLLLLTKVYGQLSWWVSFTVTLSMVIAAYLGFRELGVPLPAGVLGLS
jgi:putative tricarboxylic transport membrane protein